LVYLIPEKEGKMTKYVVAAVCSLAVAMTPLCSAQIVEYGNPLLSPSLQDFGYKTLAEAVQDVQNLPRMDSPMNDTKFTWFRIPGSDSLSGGEYFFVKRKESVEIYFVMARPSHGIYQAYGPLARRSP
jgi:hypothetical protein